MSAPLLGLFTQAPWTECFIGEIKENNENSQQTFNSAHYAGEASIGLLGALSVTSTM